VNTKRDLARRAGGALVALAVGLGTWALLNLSDLRAKVGARALAAAHSDDDRARCAADLLALGEPGARKLVALAADGPDDARGAAVTALERHLNEMPDNDAKAHAVAALVFDAFATADAGGKAALLRLVPGVLTRTGNTHAPKCRAAALDALALPDRAARLAALRLAIHPDIKLRAEAVPLLNAPEPDVRAAALFAVATATDGEVLLTEEELFRWLHDADAGVRRVCRDALLARDRTGSEIELARRLTSPDSNERLKLLLDLRYDDDVSDPAPWLERLGRDPEPGVRAGAARVAAELALARQAPCPAWVGRIADTDPHPTVRSVAGYYRSRPNSAPPGVRPVGGP